MREFPSRAGKLSWNGGISAVNFFGFDINPFAVELAKVTLNIAKKIAFEERKAQAFALAGQVEMDIDPSLPLDNLDKNIVCADALFTDWPDVDAIVSNPPFLGGSKIRKEIGPEYLARLQEAFPGVNAADYCVYWFRRTHDRLRVGGRAGLVGTSGIRVGWTREASLDYVASRGGTITNAVSSRVWPGEAAINVSMVNWIKGAADGPFSLVVDDQVYSLAHIPTHLQLHTDLSTARSLNANEHGASKGLSFGHPAFRSGDDTFARNAFGAGPHIRPVASANALLRGRHEGVCIWLADCQTEREAEALGGAAFDFLKKHVYTLVSERAASGKETAHYKHWLRTWWKAQMPRAEFFEASKSKRRLLVCPRNAARPIFLFLSRAFIPTDTLYLFAFDDDYSFGIIQSNHHWSWTVGKGTRVREDITYSSEGWRSLPWPQDPTEDQVAAVAEAGRVLRRTRESLMSENGWTLRQLHQAAEVDGPHPLKGAQAALDAAVSAAYGVPPDQSPAEFLLELNKLVAEDEERGRQVRGPGLPDNVDQNDPRWMSTDCIEPPPVEN